MVQQLLLIRHGHTDWNAQRRWQGLQPTSLNRVGFQQAEALARHLRDDPVGAVYSSDLPRAFETAVPLAAELDLEVQQDARLREVDVGVLQGLWPHEVDEQYAEEAALWRAGDYDYALPRGESRRELQVRAYAAIEEILAKAEAETVAIVTHGGTVRVLLDKMLPHTSTRGTPIGNTSISTIVRNGDGWEAVSLFATPHLSDDGLPTQDQQSL